MVLVCFSSDISGLLVSQPSSRAAVHADAGQIKAADQGATQGRSKNAMIITAVAGSALVALLLVSVLIAKRIRRKRHESDEAMIIEDMPGFNEASVS